MHKSGLSYKHNAARHNTRAPTVQKWLVWCQTIKIGKFREPKGFQKKEEAKKEASWRRAKRQSKRPQPSRKLPRKQQQPSKFALVGKNPAKSKKPRFANMLFVMANRENVKAANPTISAKKLTAHLGEMRH